MLKIKKELNYRRGLAHSHCSDCNHYVEIWISGIENEDRATQGRCQLIGLKPGRMYRVNAASICDRFDGSVALERAKKIIGSSIPVLRR